MKRTVDEFRTPLQEENEINYESKKRKQSSPGQSNKHSNTSELNSEKNSKIVSHTNGASLDDCKTPEDLLSPSSSLPANRQSSGHQYWDPIWGQRNSGISRSNLNFCDLESRSHQLVPSSSATSRNNRCSYSVQSQKSGVEPASFLSLEEKFIIANLPDDHCKGKTNKFDKVSKEIWSHFTKYQQHGKIFRQKIELWNELERVLRRRFRCPTHVFGSTLNGFGSHESDMDLCMFNGEIKSKKGKDDVRLLAEVRRTIRRECGSFISGNIELVPAKIPILKFYDHHGNIEVDLSCNNQTSVRNTNLLFCYSQMDWRVRPLVLAIKDWAKATDINEARFSTLSSYCLSLMVLHFLQVGVKDPVVPNLHELHPQVFHPGSNIFELPFTYDIEPSYKSNNKMSLGELLFSFFEYYTKHFDFTNDVGSIRAGMKLSGVQCQSYAKTNKISPGQWSAYILMEEPFDRSNAGRAICKRDKFDLILKVFDQSLTALKNGKTLEYLFRKNTKE